MNVLQRVAASFKALGCLGGHRFRRANAPDCFCGYWTGYTFHAGDLAPGESVLVPFELHVEHDEGVPT